MKGILLQRTEDPLEWGFCMKSCTARLRRVSFTLNMVEMETFPETSCYANESVVSPDLELCVGGRLVSPVVGHYVRSYTSGGGGGRGGTGSGHLSRGREEEEEEETFALVNKTGGQKYDFYGYKDTCQV